MPTSIQVRSNIIKTFVLFGHTLALDINSNQFGNRALIATMSKLAVFILASLALQAIFSEHRVAAQKNVMEILVVVDPETAEWWRLLSVSIGENWNEELYR